LPEYKTEDIRWQYRLSAVRPSIAAIAHATRHLGMLLQIDGSCHCLLEEGGPYLTLMAAIDDATGKLVTFISSLTQFVETAAAGLLSLGYEPTRIKTERVRPT
jgi:hypothetical protein